MLDLHVHDAHFIRVLWGMPQSVFSTGRMRGDVPEHFTTQFVFGDSDLAVSATCGVIQQQGRPFTHGFEIHLQRATLLFDFAVMGNQPVVQTPLTILSATGKVQRPRLPADDPVRAFEAELFRQPSSEPLASADQGVAVRVAR